MKSALAPRPRHTVRGKQVTILVAEFHPALSRGLVSAATEVLRSSGVAASAIRLVRVPGAFELPVVAAKIASGKRAPDAVVALGVLIRGQTPQYEVLAHAVADGLSQVSVQTGVPVAFGVIVADTVAQAKARAVWPARRGRRRPAVENRGAEAARAAVAVLRLFESI